MQSLPTLFRRSSTLTLKNFFQGHDYLACLFFHQAGNACFSVIFLEKIPEMLAVPAEIADKVFDVEFLPEGDAVSAVPVMTAPGKIAHQAAKSPVIEVFCRTDPGLPLQDVPILVIGEALFLFDNVNDRQLFIVNAHGRSPVSSILFPAPTTVSSSPGRRRADPTGFSR